MSIATDLQRFFQRTPFLAGKSMKADVQGTMDLSLEWPLAPRPHKFDFAASVGTNTITIASPKKDQHIVVAYALFSTSAALATQRTSLFIKEKGVDPAVSAIELQSITLAVNRIKVPLINCNCVSSDGLFLLGIGAVYVPPPYELFFSYVGAAGGEACGLRTFDYTFPATQPLSTLIEF